MSRLARGDWLSLARALLVRDGPGALTVETLCAAAGRTRGSLYHHFENRDALVTALAEDWRVRGLEAIVRGAGIEAGAPDAGVRLAALAAALDPDGERAMRRWAAHEPIVAETAAQIDAARREAVAGVLRAGGLAANAGEARHRATVFYAAFLGLLELEPRVAARKAALDTLGSAMAALSAPRPSSRRPSPRRQGAR